MKRGKQNQNSITVEEMAEYLCISRSMGYNLVRQKGFPAFRVGCRWVIPKESFLKWVKAQTNS